MQCGSGVDGGFQRNGGAMAILEDAAVLCRVSVLVLKGRDVGAYACRPSAADVEVAQAGEQDGEIVDRHGREAAAEGARDVEQGKVRAVAYLDCVVARARAVGKHQADAPSLLAELVALALLHRDKHRNGRRTDIAASARRLAEKPCCLIPEAMEEVEDDTDVREVPFDTQGLAAQNRGVEVVDRAKEHGRSETLGLGVVAGLLRRAALSPGSGRFVIRGQRGIEGMRDKLLGTLSVEARQHAIELRDEERALGRDQARWLPKPSFAALECRQALNNDAERTLPAYGTSTSACR
jgi:hypothetical protein